MQVTLSGNVGADSESKIIPLRDGTGSLRLVEASLAVKTGADTPDWYKLKFLGDNFATIANRIAKGVNISIVGDLTFEFWNDKETGERKSKAAITVLDLQLPPLPQLA